MVFSIRSAMLSDADELAELHVRTWREAYAHLLPDDFFSAEHIAGRHRMWRHVLADTPDGMTIRVADIDREITGFAWAGPAQGVDEDPPPRERQLYAIYASATHYGTGIGQALLAAVLGEEPAMLWVAKENPRATVFTSATASGSTGPSRSIRSPR